MEYKTIEVKPIASHCGADIFGADLSKPLDAVQVAEIRDAYFDNGIVVFHDQDMSHEDHIRFARYFGDLEVHPIVNGMEGHPEIIKVLKPANQNATFGTGWHTDNSFFERPSLGSVLYGVTIPPKGGDTLYASQYAAYDALSDGMKRMLGGMTAIHSAKYAYTSASAEEKYDTDGPITYRRSEAVYDEVEHPVIRTVAETVRKALYVNPLFTIRFKDMTEEESAPLLKYLYEHATRPEFQCRIRWQPKSVAFWDNRAVQHYAMDDYFQYERMLFRVTVNGERPV